MIILHARAVIHLCDQMIAKINFLIEPIGPDCKPQGHDMKTNRKRVNKGNNHTKVISSPPKCKEKTEI